MAQSACPKCGGNRFELVSVSPNHANYQYLYHQCTNCGSVVGTSEYYNIGAVLTETPDSIKNKLTAIEGRISNIEGSLHNVLNALNTLATKKK